MAIQAANLNDLFLQTLRNLGPGKWTDNATDYYSTIATQLLLNKRKVDLLTSGTEIQFNRMTGVGDSFRFVGMYETDVVDVPQNAGVGQMPWRHATWNWAWDRREMLMNREPARIVDLMKFRRTQALGNMIVGFEQAIWRVPSASNDTDIHGIPYFIVKSNTTATQANNNGFNGLAPSGYTTVAAINPTTDLRWRNYATQYTNPTKDDFVRKARRMAKYTGFKPIVSSTPEYDTGAATEYYTNYALESVLTEMLESQNENLGTDIAKYENQLQFLRTPVTCVQELDLDTTNPFYQINWGVFYVKGLSGAWMTEVTEDRVSGKHNVTAVFGDCTLNLVCVDRRKCGVLATDTTMP